MCSLDRKELLSIKCYLNKLGLHLLLFGTKQDWNPFEPPKNEREWQKLCLPGIWLTLTLVLTILYDGFYLMTIFEVSKNVYNP